MPSKLESPRPPAWNRPQYTLSEAARWAKVHPSTLRYWVRGKTYSLAHGREGVAPPIVSGAEDGPALLSFQDLVELLVIAYLRAHHAVRLEKLREAADYMRDQLGIERPFLHQLLVDADGRNLFIEKYGSLLNVSRKGQTELRGVVEGFIRRVDFDADGLARRVYLFTRPARPLDSPRAIAIDPTVRFGQPFAVGCAVETRSIAARFQAGETIGELAEDYRTDRDEIEEAIRYEESLKAA